MKQSKVILSLVSVLLAFCLFAGNPCNAGLVADAAENSSGYESLSNEEKQAYLEQQLKEVNKKLDELEGQSKETQEYISALDEKIRYMKDQLDLAKQGIETSKNEITELRGKYEENEKQIAALQTDINDLSNQNKKLKKEFDKSLDMYFERARAMYVSGNMTVLEALLTSGDVSTLLTRLEMIRRVSQMDRELLQTLQSQGKELTDTQKKLSDKKTSLSNNQKELVTTQRELTATLSSLESQQIEYTDKQADYESEKDEADTLLLNLQRQTKNYSEFRHQDQEELDEINRQIEEAAEKYLQQQQSTTTTTTTTTSPSGSHGSGSKPSTTKPATTSPSSNKLSMTFPVPSQTKITTAYGSAGYVGHTGVDFACASGSKVVAAESGTVIISEDLKNSDGSYRSYGRYIVIAHDKKDSAGNNVYTLYAHNSSRVVSEGQYVKKGQLIAYSGSTGNSSGPHCHFEVRTPTAAYNDCVNPTYYLP